MIYRIVRLCVQMSVNNMMLACIYFLIKDVFLNKARIFKMLSNFLRTKSRGASKCLIHRTEPNDIYYQCCGAGFFFYGTGTGAVSSKLRHQHRHRHQRNIQEYSTENNFGWKKKFFLSKPSKVIEMIWSTEWPKQFKYWKILHLVIQWIVIVKIKSTTTRNITESSLFRFKLAS